MFNYNLDYAKHQIRFFLTLNQYSFLCVQSYKAYKQEWIHTFQEQNRL